MNETNTKPRPKLKAQPYLLKNKIQHYAWGTRGKDAFIPNFLGIKAEADLPYAEVWMGAHPKAPSEICLDGTVVSLREVIAEQPLAVLGKRVCDTFDGTLPFLFKVLSAGEALSIQAHPNKAQAKRLHARDPEHYPDANHKPEVAIALDALTALVGFKPYAGILETLDAYPELTDFIGVEICATLKAEKHASRDRHQDLVHTLFSTLINRSIHEAQALSAALDTLAERLNNTTKPLTEKEHLFLDLRAQYPGADVGLFAIFLFNLVHLEKGQGIFTIAGVPHAYLEGNIIECMANSDNVVRVGLTPKYKDAATLIDIVNHEIGEATILEDDPSAEVVTYPTPAAEFEVSRWQLTAQASKEMTKQDEPEVWLVTEGQIQITWATEQEDATQVYKQGDAILLPALLQTFSIKTQETATVYKVEIPA